MQNDRIDSHKLIYHPLEVARWLEGETVYPINAEICIYGGCNHRCVFCAVDYIGYKPDFIDKGILLRVVSEMKEKGLKSILLAGYGEPVLHPQFCDVVSEIYNIGVEQALSTNGVMYDKKMIERTLEYFSWIRFSTSAGTEETYKKIQRGNDGDFQRVLQNISDAANYKHIHGSDTVLNVQIVMVPENMNEVVLLARQVKECGADRFIVKSVGWNAYTESEMRKQIGDSFFGDHKDLQNELFKLNDDSFQVVYRSERISNEVKKRNYNACHAAPFHVCIGANGEVWQCCNMQGLKQYSFGNLKYNSFEEIWQGEQRKDFLKHIVKSNLQECPKACKLAVMNKYLHELLHPNRHVNFI